MLCSLLLKRKVQYFETHGNNSFKIENEEKKNNFFSQSFQSFDGDQPLQGLSPKE